MSLFWMLSLPIFVGLVVGIYGRRGEHLTRYNATLAGSIAGGVVLAVELLFLVW